MEHYERESGLSCRDQLDALILFKPKVSTWFKEALDLLGRVSCLSLRPSSSKPDETAAIRGKLPIMFKGINVVISEVCQVS